MRFFWLFCFLAAGVGSAWGQYVPADRCAIVIASRPTLPAAQDYRFAQPGYGVSAIYLTQNGWYALVGDLVASADASAILSRRKSTGSVPKDAFCSSGKGFVERVWPAAVESPTRSNALLAEFDARPLDTNEKRFLQAALSLTRDYDGRLDGQWGGNSQRSLEEWSFREFQELPLNLHVAILAADGSQRLEADGWKTYFHPALGVSLQIPVLAMHEGDSENGSLKLEADDGSFDLLITRMGATAAAGLHGHLIATAAKEFSTAPYIVRNDDFWVTSFSDGGPWIYERTDFDRRTGTARTALFTSSNDVGHTSLNLIVASYQSGWQADLVIPESGVLMAYLQAAADALAEAGPKQPTPSPVAEASGAIGTTSSPSPRWSGSGFYINNAGSVMTNAHVADGCSRITVDGRPGRVNALDDQFDLAVVDVEDGLPASAVVLPFSTRAARLNADVTVAGYPLKGLLDTLNVTRGSVSALKGMENDATRLQITAPVQSGNSGGPIVDRYGQVVGVVVSKMDGLVVADATGDLPQNVNFGIRGSIARIFTEANGIDFQQSDKNAVLAPEDLAEQLSRSTVLIECY